MKSFATKRHVELRALLTLVVLSIGVVPIQADETSRILEAMIESHGGMETWASAPTVSFEVHEWFEGHAEPEVQIVTVEQGARRVYVDCPATSSRMAWDGERAWSENWQSPAPPRFLALLHYYFVNLPWMTKDPGVQLGPPGRARIPDDPTEYITIAMTFEPGTGDTPNDTYTLYIHPESHRLRACEYTMTYADLLPEGLLATSPHLLVYDEFESVHDLIVPVRFTIYETDETKHATFEIRNWSFETPFDLECVIMPDTAVLDRSKPAR